MLCSVVIGEYSGLEHCEGPMVCLFCQILNVGSLFMSPGIIAEKVKNVCNIALSLQHLLFIK